MCSKITRLLIIMRLGQEQTVFSMAPGCAAFCFTGASKCLKAERGRQTSQGTQQKVIIIICVCRTPLAQQSSAAALRRRGQMDFKGV